MEFRYGLDDRPPPLEWVFLGLQWFAVAVPSIIILGKIICTVGPAGACDPLIYLQKMFFVAALFMLIQIFLGHGLPLIVGPSTVILIGILSSPGAQPAALYTAILLGGLGLFILAWTGLFGKIRRLFTRRVVAVVLLLIAFTLTPTIIRLITVSDGGAPRWSVLFAFVLCLSMLVLHRFLGGIWRSTLILSATVAGSVAWHVLGLGSAGAESAGGSGALFGLFFTGFTTSLSFDPGLLAAFLICFIALAINDIGSIESMNAFVGDGDKGGRLRRGIAVTGLANLAAGFLGIIGQVNYSLSPGVVASSRCLSRFALVPAALLMLAVRLFACGHRGHGGRAFRRGRQRHALHPLCTDGGGDHGPDGGRTGRRLQRRYRGGDTAARGRRSGLSARRCCRDLPACHPPCGG